VLGTIFRLLGELPRLRQLFEALRPTIAELRKVAPELIPLLRRAVFIGRPALDEIMAAWPHAHPLALDIARSVVPEMVVEMERRAGPIPRFDVYWLQAALNKIGERDGDPIRIQVDGDPGPNTQKAVRRFQERYKSKYSLVVDGWSGPITTAAIYQEEWAS
jgi:hypothetical protein